MNICSKYMFQYILFLKKQFIFMRVIITINNSWWWMHKNIIYHHHQWSMMMDVIKIIFFSLSLSLSHFSECFPNSNVWIGRQNRGNSVKFLFLTGLQSTLKEEKFKNILIIFPSKSSVEKHCWFMKIIIIFFNVAAEIMRNIFSHEFQQQIYHQNIQIMMILMMCSVVCEEKFHFSRYFSTPSSWS